MVNRLANIVEQADSFGERLAQSHFSGHDAFDFGNLNGVVEDVLGKAVPEFQASQQFDQFRMNLGHTKLERGFFAGLDD